jgi:hypothetical protein
VPAVTSETRGHAQVRFARGFAEAHVLAVDRRGGDPTLGLATRQVGISGRVPRAPWYGGLELDDSRRGLEPASERRLAAYAGVSGRGGWAMTTRVEHVEAPQGAGGALSGELSCALPHGGQLGLDPRAGWREGRVDRAGATLRVSAPLPRGLGRVTGLVALEGDREGAFRRELREASLAFSLAPRPRDRGELEVRRLEEGGVASTEWSTEYEAQAQRFERFGAPASFRDSSRIRVRVDYASNGVGLANVLVSIDGRDFRYTGADGEALFERVERGTHIVSIETASLPEGLTMVTSDRLIVTVERGTTANYIVFEVARPAIRKRF